MPSRRRPIAALAAGLLAIATLTAACGASGPTLRPSTAPTPTSTTAPTTAPDDSPTAPPLTPVPGGASEDPVPPPDNTGTTQTEWGRILDAVPDTFPTYPGAEPADLPEGPNSGAWLTDAAIDDVVPWYRTAIEDAGFTIDNLSSPLEDGSRVLDVVGDLPECKAQVTFRPENGSTIIIVMYGAGCAGGEG
jgi:hypothetical protein